MASSRNVLSDSISKYRRAAGMTQEELGRRVGVSTQAVSKWECGGMPDPSLLPAVSDALGVTIDALFGRGEKDYNDADRVLARTLKQTPLELQFQKTYQLCWSMMKTNIANEQGDLGTLTDMFSALRPVERRATDSNPDAHILTHKSDRGIEEASLAEDFQYYLVLPKPQNGYSAIFRNEDSYRKLFTLLSRPNRLKLLAFLEQTKYDTFTADYAAAYLSISQQEAVEALEDLQAHQIVRHTSLATAAEVQKVYCLRSSINLIPFFLFAGQIMQEKRFPHLIVDDRKGPFMECPLGDGNPQADWKLDEKT